MRNLLLSIVVASLFLAMPVSAQAWWNTSYTYRDNISIASGDYDRFFLNVSVDTADLILNSKMNADCSDLRIVDDSGIEIERKVVDCDDTDTRIWFNYTSPSDYTMYYGYSGASAPVERNYTYWVLDGDDFDAYTPGQDPDGWLQDSNYYVTDQWGHSGSQSLNFSFIAGSGASPSTVLRALPKPCVIDQCTYEIVFKIVNPGNPTSSLVFGVNGQIHDGGSEPIESFYDSDDLDLKIEDGSGFTTYTRMEQDKVYRFYIHYDFTTQDVRHGLVNLTDGSGVYDSGWVGFKSASPDNIYYNKRWGLGISNSELLIDDYMMREVYGTSWDAPATSFLGEESYTPPTTTTTTQPGTVGESTVNRWMDLVPFLIGVMIFVVIAGNIETNNPNKLLGMLLFGFIALAILIAMTQL